MIKALGFYLCLAPTLSYVLHGAGMGANPLVVVLACGLHVLGLLLYTLLVDDYGFRRGWEVCENTCRRPPGPI